MFISLFVFPRVNGNLGKLGSEFHTLDEHYLLACVAV
jgi:hypothetical protein